MQKEETSSPNPYFDRDLSWLSFNYRVLLEAKNPAVPLLERLKFLAIYSSNQDEFFRVRVASLRRLAQIKKKGINKNLGVKPEAVLAEIERQIPQQLDEFGAVLREEVLPQLEQEGARILLFEQLDEGQKKATAHFFKTQVLAYLQPRNLPADPDSQFLNNQQLYLVVRLQSKTPPDESTLSVVNIPSGALPRFVELPTEKGLACIYLDDIIKAYLPQIYPGYTIAEVGSVKLNRDSNLLIEDELDGDLIDKIKRQIRKRDLGVPCRLLYDQGLSQEIIRELQSKMRLDDHDLVAGGSYHNLSDFMDFPDRGLNHLKYPKEATLSYQPILEASSIFEAIDKQDQLLHFPYHSYDHVLQFFNQAAIDPEVHTIYTTFYRIASNSLIGEALSSAAMNGKEVTVFIEVKARFDEANNLHWADRLERAGVKIIYSLPELKVHAKVALVGRKGQRWYSYLATGNLNEKTASLYTDFGLFTRNKKMGKELKSLFVYLQGGESPTFESLMVARFNLQSTYLELMNYEIAQAKAGKPSRIIIKLNNLEEREMIDKLYEASQARVPIDLIIRGICCLRPGVPGLSENIKVTRIVGRYLEHARILWFHHSGDEVCHIGSSDWMNRNLHHRIEVNVPIVDAQWKAHIRQLLEIQLNDRSKAVRLDQELNNQFFEEKDQGPDAQAKTRQWLTKT